MTTESNSENWVQKHGYSEKFILHLLDVVNYNENNSINFLTANPAIAYKGEIEEIREQADRFRKFYRIELERIRAGGEIKRTLPIPMPSDIAQAQ